MRSDYFTGLDKLLKWCFRGNCFALNFGNSRSAAYMAFHCVASNCFALSSFDFGRKTSNDQHSLYYITENEKYQ